MTRSCSTLLAAAFLQTVAPTLPAATFVLPTANTNIFVPGGEPGYFVPTVGKEWSSGTFGCVRSDGWQFHEGIDIKAQERDKHGEPIDPVMAIADGVVLYVNARASLSNYGNYIIVGHRIDGLDVCTIYAHLREIQEGITAGTRVHAGMRIATLGRTANTRSGISKDRAHVHLEVGLFLNTRFPKWYANRMPGERNDHGMFNGQNVAGFDPWKLLVQQHREGSHFNLIHFIQSQPELCRVQVRDTNFEFLRRYGALVEHRTELEGARPDGYEIVFSYSGVPMKLIPRTARELKSRARIQLVSVDEAVQKEHPCRKLVVQRRGRWELATNGQRLLELLLY
jgi:murein DD-endopeptidase MepM/ murein hydrolase activator NlpD